MTPLPPRVWWRWWLWWWSWWWLWLWLWLWGWWRREEWRAGTLATFQNKGVNGFPCTDTSAMQLDCFFFNCDFSIVLSTSYWPFHALSLLLYLRLQSLQFCMQYHCWSQGFPNRNLAHGRNKRWNMIISEPPGSNHAIDVVTCFSYVGISLVKSGQYMCGNEGQRVWCIHKHNTSDIFAM